jgi:hypothetical protein
MQITRTSMFSGITRTQEIPVTQEQLDAWASGVLIQKAMPQLSDDEREFIMTGITAEEWDSVFSD